MALLKCKIQASNIIIVFLFLLSCKSDVPSESNLPVVSINTNWRRIPDDPKIQAKMKIYSPGKMLLNRDMGDLYNGEIKIERRGHVSQTWPQKSFSLETYENKKKSDVSLLGLPPESDWVLLSTYNDQTFLENLLAFHLFEQMGHYAPRAKLCEVVINNDYKGIYLFTEKIKASKKRVPINKMKNGGDITGGYIFSVDYYENKENWTSNFHPIGRPEDTVHFLYVYPKPGNITPVQKEYIKNSVDEFEKVLFSDRFNDPTNGYSKFIDINSFIDIFIINEISRNPDSYRKSCYYYKEAQSKGGLIHSGPVWDFDYAWENNPGNNCFDNKGTDGSGWTYIVTECNKYPASPSWIARLLEDEKFRSDLYARYNGLRKSILSDSYIDHYTDSIKSMVNQTQIRHYIRWPILGLYEGKGERVNTSYEKEVEQFKTWIRKRLNWLDQNFPR